MFTGDCIGVYHPDLTAPGFEISSTCDSAGTPAVIGPCPPPAYGNEIASGTSMASPHVAGAVAVLKQANPALSVEQVRLALQATATPVTSAADARGVAPFWHAGYGYVDLGAAVSLVTHKHWLRELSRAAAAADTRVLATDGFKVDRSDFWTYDAPRLAAGKSDNRTFATSVPRARRA